MDNLKNDVKLLQAWMCETRRVIHIVRKDVMKLGKQQEGVEHQIPTLEERLVGLEKCVDIMGGRVNDVIERINTFHMYLKKQLEDEDEVLGGSDDGKMKEQ